MISLGCDKNRVDSERMLFALKSAGYTITDNGEEAEVMIINTCAFIESAKKEAIETIFETASMKARNLKKLLVTGCFAQRYPDVEFPEVDRFVSIAEEERIAEIVAEETGIPFATCGGQGRVLTTPAHYAYLKIADGCNNRCSYCAIPAIRGRYKSEPKEKLVEEAKALRADGVQELILVAQDTTAYGMDLYKKPALCELLRALLPIGFWKIRLLYAYPERITDELIAMLRDEEGLAKYIDMPLQHIDGDILKRMRRPASEEKIRSLLAKIRKEVPDCTVRSTFIVGFPSESEEQFLKLNAFIGEGACRFAGFFCFSPEEGTEAEQMKPRVGKSVSARRRTTIEKTQSAVTVEAQKAFIGRELEVLYEGIDFDKQTFVGRTEYNAPDVDTNVYFTADFAPQVGSVYRVKIE